MTFVILSSPIILKKYLNKYNTYDKKDNLDKILMIRRAKEPFKGHWQLPGGKIKLGEKPIDALKREVKEEVGLDVDIEKTEFVNYYEHYYHEFKTHFFFLAFRCCIADEDGKELDNIEEINKKIRLAQEEATEYGWFTKKELKDMNLLCGARIITDNYNF
ncbi:MAG: NUDIX domain-containing protein [Candidatus Woesearchaeota archaeon]